MKQPNLCGRATECWRLIGDTAVLYTENANLKEPALAAGLRIMATHTRNGRLYAMQFVGPREAVLKLAGEKIPFRPFS